MNQMPQKHAIVVGAGLAGLTAAVSLADDGFAVTVCESDSTPGGKCKARWNGRYHEEHAYHILPAWYVNLWSLVDRLGVRRRFIDQHEYFYLEAGQFPEACSLRDFGSPASAWRNLWAGVIGPVDSILFFYSLLDIVSARLEPDSWYDQLSVHGFLRSKWYMRASVAQCHEDVLFKTFAVASYHTALSSYQALYRSWLKSPTPTMRLPDGDVQSTLIGPLAAHLAAKGGDIRLNTSVTRLRIAQGVVRGVEIRDAAGNIEEVAADGVVLALPVEGVLALLEHNLVAIAPRLARLREAISKPIGSLHVLFKTRLPSLPRGIMTLVDARYGLTAVDNGQLWGLETTLLNVVATDVVELGRLDAAAAGHAILEELRRFIPFAIGDVEQLTYESHEKQPLFATTVGSWLWRPNVSGDVPGLYLSGDFCRSHVDVVCVEGAVVTGLMAARACCLDVNGSASVEVKRAPVLRRWQAWAYKLALLPLVTVLVVWNWLMSAGHVAPPRRT